MCFVGNPSVKKPARSLEPPIDPNRIVLDVAKVVYAGGWQILSSRLRFLDLNRSLGQHLTHHHASRQAEPMMGGATLAAASVRGYDVGYVLALIRFVS
jgi:hypothetical protein